MLSDETYLAQVKAVTSLEDLEALRFSILGKQGRLSVLLKEVGALPLEHRREQGQRLNIMRQTLEHAFSQQKSSLEMRAIEEQLAREKEDMTLPCPSSSQGRIHPFSQVLHEVISLFKKMGFQGVQGPHIETDHYNFTALNMAPDHPARQDHDTFYLRARDENGHRKVLRTHTSPVQIRTLLAAGAPLKIIVPGRVYRSDSDATHTPNFHQIEGLYVDADVTLGHLKWCLVTFLKEFFRKEDLCVRFRPSYFPFTEPSLEVDIGYKKTKGQLILEGADHWLEILGCGMVHPKVLEHAKIDPTKVQGFAFGMGLERLAMLKYGISDLRSFYESDIRWLNHYGFKSYEALSEGVLS